MNNSQSIERFGRYFRVIDGCELSADQRKAALLADGLISPKTTFFSDNREINPEIAGYGVLSSSNVRGRFRQLGATVQCVEFSTLFLEREQSGVLGTERDFWRRQLWATNWP